MKGLAMNNFPKILHIDASCPYDVEYEIFHHDVDPFVNNITYLRSDIVAARDLEIINLTVAYIKQKIGLDIGIDPQKIIKNL